MSDALRLPAHPNLEFYKNVARDFQQAARSAQPDAIRDWADNLCARTATADPDLPRRLDRFWRDLIAKKPKLGACRLADAQWFLARAHGFASWPVFAAHVEALARQEAGTTIFESAVDAIVAGDAGTLRRLLDDYPDLVRSRSTRAHCATLLHYVSANGVEDFRQKTPPNIVDIARMLLDAGADVNAESSSYGPGDTTLLLTATSAHPDGAGVQIPLIELLLERGARIDAPGAGSTVTACLHNGRGRAADYLAARGGRLDLESAAGVGRLDAVRGFFDANGNLANGATRQQRLDGFAWACQFGKTDVVAFLLDRGVTPDVALPHDGQTGLHWAAYDGHLETVRLLLARGAPAAAKDSSYDGTPLEWALYGWANRTMTDADEAGYYDVVRELVRAGSTLDPAWFSEDDTERTRAARKLQADPRMQEALKRATSPTSAS